MFAKVGDVDIFYTTTGTGPMCLVPSLAGTPIYERTFTPALQEVMTLVFVEVRGNRTTDADAATLTFDRVVDDLDGVRRALGVDRIAVLGHSAHSMFALAYAARYPQHTSHVLVIAGTPAMNPGVFGRAATYWELVASPERKRLAAEKQAAVTPERLAHLTPSQRFIAMYAAGGPKSFPDATYDCTPLWDGHENMSEAVLGRFWGPQSPFATFDADAALPKITAPVFIGQGVLDFIAPPYIWDGERQKMPASTYVAFERSGHYPPLDEREAFRDAVAAWLVSAAKAS